MALSYLLSNINEFWEKSFDFIFLISGIHPTGFLLGFNTLSVSPRTRFFEKSGNNL